MEGSIVDTRDGRRRPFRWQYGIVVFGSGVEADLVLPDPAVAAKHGRFEVTAEGCRVVVEEGGKPVKVNGVSTHESVVEVGDVVKIGPFQLSLAGQSSGAPAPAPAAEAPAAAAQKSAAPYARRPVAASRHTGSSRHAAAHGAPADDTGVDEARAAARYRARTAGSHTDARSWLIGGAILAGIVLIGVGFFVFSGNPWAGLADDTMLREREALNAYVKSCDFDRALVRINQLMTMADDSSLKNKLIDERTKIEKHKKNFDEGSRELERIRNTVGKRQNYYIVNDDLPLYISNYGAYAPLVQAGMQLQDELRHGKMTSPAPAAGTSEADLAPGATAPAFNTRPDRDKGKEKN